MHDKGNNGDKDLYYKDMNRILCLLKLHVFDYHEILTPITSYKYKKCNGIVWHPCIINYGLLYWICYLVYLVVNIVNYHSIKFGGLLMGLNLIH